MNCKDCERIINEDCYCPLRDETTLNCYMMQLGYSDKELFKSKLGQLNDQAIIAV